MTMINRLAEYEKTSPPAPWIASAMKDAAACEKFVFDRVARAAMINLGFAKPTSLAAAFPLCRLPFGGLWLEWPAIQPDEVTPGRACRMPAEDEITPRTIGALIKQSACGDPAKFTVSFLWEWPAGGSQLSGKFAMNPLSIVVDLADTVDPDFLKFRQMTLGKYEKDIIAKKYKPEDFLTACEIEQRFIPMPCPYMADFFQGMMESNRIDLMKKAFAMGIKDAEGEMNMVIGALCLINSRNCVDIKPVDVSGINRARAKSRKLPLLSYSTVHLALSRADRRAMINAPDARQQTRQHLVRGHFKVKRKGIYWWRPHIRGNLALGEVRHNHYEVRQ